LIQTTYTKAAKAELAKDFDLAFKLYIKAADDFLHQSRTTADAKLKSHCKTRVNVALQRAEKIKSVIPDLIPVVRDSSSERE
jgi:calpain-7